ncbi:MAG: adenylyl-sulfate kinase [Bacteroidota bacterium]
MSRNIHKHHFKITSEDRIKANGYKPLLIWFTGLSGSGKSTIANLLEKKLYNLKISTYTLDGDNLRGGLCKDLSFSPEDRKENIRRVAEVSRLFLDAGIVVLSAFVSPYKKDRNNIRHLVKDSNFVEVYVNTSLAECERRDTKGLYKKARTGEIKDMTGISSPYEAPENPDVEINTEIESAHDAAKRILGYIKPRLGLNNG